MDKTLETIKKINFEHERIPNFDSKATNTNEEYLSDIILRDMKEIENSFTDLITNSSLRYLRKITEIYNL